MKKLIKIFLIVSILIAFSGELSAQQKTCYTIDRSRAEWLKDESNPVKDVDDSFSEITLSVNFPNPFNNSTNINYYLNSEISISIDIIDLMGNRVRSLMSEKRAGGNNRLVWDCTDDNGHSVSSGTYIVRLIAGKTVKTIRIQLIKN